MNTPAELFVGNEGTTLCIYASSVYVCVFTDGLPVSASVSVSVCVCVCVCTRAVCACARARREPAGACCDYRAGCLSPRLPERRRQIRHGAAQLSYR